MEWAREGPILVLSSKAIQFKDVAKGKDSSYRQDDDQAVSVTLPQISRAVSEFKESESPWTQPSITELPTEDTIRDNLTDHREAILHYLDPSHLFKLLSELELDEISTSTQLTRHKQADILLDKVIEEEEYLKFLVELDVSTEHMGHKYIVSLLRGEEFAREEEIEQSEILKKCIGKESSLVIRQLNVHELIPHLYSHELITSEERERLENLTNTSQERARMLLTILKTKGPTAHFTFVHKCLAVEDRHLGHRELYQLLTVPRETRKRRASSSCTIVSKRYPCLLDPPEGITTDTYIQKITKIREDTLKGGKMWEAAEAIVKREVDAPGNPLEMKIAILLESCNMCMLNRQPDEVVARVDRAREMCMSLYSQEGNAQVLEGRCEWVLARLYKFKGDFGKAKTHIDMAFTTIANCAKGEEKILISFVNGSIILDSKTSSRKDLRHAINSFKFAISLASEEDYGMKMLQYCKIRLAQAYVGSSMDDPLENADNISQDNINEAKRVLRDMEHEKMHPRTRWTYMITCADVYRLDGQLDQALAFAEKGFEFARKNNLVHETSEAVLALYKEYKRKLLKVT